MSIRFKNWSLITYNTSPLYFSLSFLLTQMVPIHQILNQTRLKTNLRSKNPHSFPFHFLTSSSQDDELLDASHFAVRTNVNCLRNMNCAISREMIAKMAILNPLTGVPKLPSPLFHTHKRIRPIA